MNLSTFLTNLILKNHWFGRNELNYVHYQDFNTFQEE